MATDREQHSLDALFESDPVKLEEAERAERIAAWAGLWDGERETLLHRRPFDESPVTKGRFGRKFGLR